MNGGISRRLSLIYALKVASQPHPVIVRACAHTEFYKRALTSAFHDIGWVRTSL